MLRISAKANPSRLHQALDSFLLSFFIFLFSVSEKDTPPVL